MLITIVRSENGTYGVLMVVAAMIGGYMAMNIGANGAANNVGAIVIAALFEASGALIAGGDVVNQPRENCLSIKPHFGERR